MNVNTIHTFQTGDLLLCHHGNETDTYREWILYKWTSLLDIFTSSPYTHVAIVLRNPTFMQESVPFGLYVWEYSSNPLVGLDNKPGIRITPLLSFLNIYRKSGGRIVHRSIVGSNRNAYFSDKNLRIANDVIYTRSAALYPPKNGSYTARFLCSAFVAYIYTQCGIISSATHWSSMRPCDFDLDTDDMLQYQSPQDIKLSDHIRCIDLVGLDTCVIDTCPV